MKATNALLLLALAMAAPVAAVRAEGLGDVLKQIVKEAASDYQAQSHYGQQSGYYPYTAPPRDADKRVRNQHAYDVGYRVGQDDFHHHLDKHFVRHPDLYDDETHDAFGKGYESGYDAARAGLASTKATYNQPVAVREPVKSDRYPSGYYPYASPPSGQSAAVRNHHAYEVGFRVGQDDFNHGHSKHFVHHEDLFDDATRDSFAHGYEQGYDAARAHKQGSAPEAAQSLGAKTVQGGVEIHEGGNVIARIKTAMPNVEKTKLINGGRQIVTKSRGNHGPATVELFDTGTGTLRDKVLAFAIKGGRPSWAAGFED